jgi:TonB family protein
MRAGCTAAWVFAALVATRPASSQEPAAEVAPVTHAGAPEESCDDRPPTPLGALTKPIYPREAYRKGIEGVVEIEFLIDTKGRVEATRIVRSIPELDAAAIECVRSWLFRPAYKEGRAVSTVARAPVTFKNWEKIPPKGAAAVK